ncbi:MAG: GerMN domain-containing protein [Acidimicrobiales bacterium]
MLAVALALLLGLSLAACGIPADATAHRIPAKQVPFGLLQPAASRATPETIGGPTEALVYIYLVGTSQHLVQVNRFVAKPVTVDEVVKALLAGPNGTETTNGISSAVSDRAVLRSAKVSYLGVANLDLTLPNQLTGSNQTVAVAQLVYTATGVPGVTGVTFSVNGKAVQVPDGTGTLVQGPVSRSDYPSLGPVR